MPTRDCSASIAISPLKPFLGDAYHQLVERLQNAICVRYGLPAWTVKEKRVHKEADRTAAATEAVRVVGWTEEEVQRVLRIPYEPLTKDPLAAALWRHGLRALAAASCGGALSDRIARPHPDELRAEPQKAREITDLDRHAQL